ncbi:MAG: deoxyribodipyrimidine photo-lyase [Alphaproteobacteria bacterium]
MTASPIILWFKDDFRFVDNAALNAAAKTKRTIIPIIISDKKLNPKAKEWRLSSVSSLAKKINTLQGNLYYFDDENKSLQETIILICRLTSASEIYTSESASFNKSEKEFELQKELSKNNLLLHISPPNLLVARDAVRNKTGNPYQKFAGFYNRLLELDIETPVSAPKDINFYNSSDLEKYIFKQYTKPNNFYAQPGEEGAFSVLEYFIKNRLKDYSVNREFPAITGTSMLSPYIALGEISVKTIWHTVKQSFLEQDKISFLRQVVWREFCYDLLKRYPNMAEKPIRDNFASFPWTFDKELFEKWQNGITGYPLVDAGIRELNQTGYMHNRVRMITASFLTKHLLIPWQFGEKYFKEKLLDYDEANNAGNWQWVAGCGMDSAPFFRIFNPELQAQKFDSKQEYILKYIPEFFTSYPKPIVNHQKAREAALTAYHTNLGRI